MGDEQGRPATSFVTLSSPDIPPYPVSTAPILCNREKVLILALSARLTKWMRKSRGLRLSESCENLVELAKAGDVRAFEALVPLHQDRVHALAYRMLGNAEDVADVQQETFVNAWRNLRKFRRESQFSTWLHRITVNLCLSRIRRSLARRRALSGPRPSLPCAGCSTPCPLTTAR
mgnify:CR=1 FL=1